MVKRYASLSEYPHLTCYWRVFFDGDQFSAYEVSGLNEKMEYVSYRSGAEKEGYVAKQLAGPQGGTLTITWGIFSTNRNGAHIFHKWRDDRTTDPEKKTSVDIQITLLDEYANDVMKWNCKNCLPLEYQGPTLKADESAIAMQTLILEVEEIKSEFIHK